MSDPSLDVQGVVVTTLKATGALPTAVGGRVYDAAPANATFPYITLGDAQVLPDKAGCIDGVEMFLQIDAWSRATGYPEVKEIAKAIVAELDDQPMDIPGYQVVIFEHQETRYMRDPDGLTRHAAMTFRSLINPA